MAGPLQTLAAAIVVGGGMWLATAIGAAFVLARERSPAGAWKLAVPLVGGVMLCASVLSLAWPAFVLAGWEVAFFGGLLGVALYVAFDRLLARALPRTGSHRAWATFGALTAHNVPEGLAVGLAVGASTGQALTDPAVWALAVGLMAQDVPEGFAAALPFRAEGARPLRAFLIGQSSGAVELVAALLGVFVGRAVAQALPIGLAIAAGVMIAAAWPYVVPSIDAPRSRAGWAMLSLGAFGMAALELIVVITLA